MHLRYLTLYSECPTDPFSNATALPSSSSASSATRRVRNSCGCRTSSNYNYELSLASTLELPTPAPTLPVEPSPAPTVPETCDYVPVECGDSVIGYLGHLDKVTLANSSEPTTRLLFFGFMADFNATTALVPLPHPQE